MIKITYIRKSCSQGVSHYQEKLVTVFPSNCYIYSHRFLPHHSSKLQCFGIVRMLSMND